MTFMMAESGSSGTGEAPGIRNQQKEAFTLAESLTNGFLFGGNKCNARDGQTDFERMKNNEHTSYVAVISSRLPFRGGRCSVRCEKVVLLDFHTPPQYNGPLQLLLDPSICRNRSSF